MQSAARRDRFAAAIAELGLLRQTPTPHSLKTAARWRYLIPRTAVAP